MPYPISAPEVDVTARLRLRTWRPLNGGRHEAAPERQRGPTMHLQLLRALARPQPPRPAKVVQLEARRQARLDVARPLDRPPSRPAA